jgi:hypothetical protein
MFTGTLIEDLIATVERTEQTLRADDNDDNMVAPYLVGESWFASIQESADFESKLFEVA